MIDFFFWRPRGPGRLPNPEPRNREASAHELPAQGCSSVPGELLVLGGVLRRVCDCRQQALFTLSPFGCTSQTLLLTGEEADSAGFGGAGPHPLGGSSPGPVSFSFGSYDRAPRLGWASLVSCPGLWGLSLGCQSSGSRMADTGAAAGRISQTHPRDCAHSITHYTSDSSLQQGSHPGGPHLVTWACR